MSRNMAYDIYLTGNFVSSSFKLWYYYEKYYVLPGNGLYKERNRILSFIDYSSLQLDTKQPLKAVCQFLMFFNELV